MQSPHTPSRRDVLLASGIALGTTPLAGCLSSANSGNSTDESPTESTMNKPNTTVNVGPEGNLTFKPEHLEIRPGSTVRWVWKSDDHNIVVDKQPENADWNGSPGSQSDLHDSGFSFTHTFDTLGTFQYYCQPHQSAGMTAEIVVTETPQSPTPTDTQDADDSAGTEEETPTDTPASVMDKTDQEQISIAVGPDGSLEFDPEAVKISSDTTAIWTWNSDGHNVVPESQPDGANWKGHEPLEDSGFTYEHTFNTTGTYQYYCQPHKAAGMTGRLIVE